MVAPKKRVKKQEHEKLTDANIARVVQLLEAEKPITKKEACEILNISYNTTRLASIVEDYKSRKENQTRRKAEKRGTPISDTEIGSIVEAYLNRDSLQEISERVYRSTEVVKRVLERIGVPARPAAGEGLEVEFLPEGCVSYEFYKGEIAWSAKYHSPCEIDSKLDQKHEDMYMVPCYRVWVREPSESVAGGFYAFCPAYDLGKLSHLAKYGVRLETL